MKALIVNVASWLFRSLPAQRRISRIVLAVWPGFRHV